jgi:hypothetical protein
LPTLHSCNVIDLHGLSVIFWLEVSLSFVRLDIVPLFILKHEFIKKEGTILMYTVNDYNVENERIQCVPKCGVAMNTCPVALRRGALYRILGMKQRKLI